MENSQNITEKMKLSQVYIDDDKEITFEYLYSNIISMLKNPESNEIERLEIVYNNYMIKLIKNNKIFCDINIFKNNVIVKKLEMVFIKPLKIYYKLEKIEISLLTKFDEMPELLGITNPSLFCLNHGETIDYDIKDLIKHLQNCKFGLNQCKIEISEKSIDEEGNSERFFYEFFRNIEDKKEFDNPIDFEINYEDYFDFYKYQVNEKKFEFLDDENSSRYLSIAKLLCSRTLLGYLRIYFGQAGIGKSTTLIKAFKYRYNHDSFGTLYIHCKCLSKYYRDNFEKMKRILKSEIIYLFKNEYDIYKRCLKFIDSSRNHGIFFDLVMNIITNFCKTKTKKYIFIFDQYKPEFDHKNALNSLYKGLIKNNKNYGIIACCSMDNRSVRDLKMKYLSKIIFMEEGINEEVDKNIIIKEINELFDISYLSIDNGGIFDLTLNKIGKNLKNYFILMNFFNTKNYDAMENYVNDLKEKITNNLKDFFKLNKKIQEENEGSNLINLYNILSFTVDTNYKIEYIKKIKNYIPFKYFDIKSNNDNENTSKIIFLYDLVGEVMNELYEYIIYENNNIYEIFDNINLDRGALGGLYEKYVIYFMEPNKYTHEKNLFNLFNVKEIVTVEKFVPTTREKYFEHKFKLRTLKEGDYLFIQKQFGGKAFDCAIIRIGKNGEAQVFFFQISIHKSIIYTITELNIIIDEFIKYFSYQFKNIIRKENVYFTYIFHTKGKDKFCEDCDKNNLKCIFFNPSFQSFTNRDDVNLDDINFKSHINDIFVNPFTFNKNDIDMKDMTEYQIIQNINQPSFILNKKQKKQIEKIWKIFFPEFKNNTIEIYYSHYTHFIDENFLSNKIMYLRTLNENEINDWIDAIIDEDKKKEGMKKNNVLLIYKEINFAFRIISEDGNIYKIKYLPIIMKGGLKNYDVYFVKTSLNI